MADWFDFAGVRSTSLGVSVQGDYPGITTGEERAKFQPVPGSSGFLTLLEGDAVYDGIVLSVGCYMRNTDSIDQVSAWLRGSGLLVLGNAPDRAYFARCVNQIELKKIVRGKKNCTFNAVFRCSPYRYVFPEPPALFFTTSPGTITNPGTAAAEPIITVVGGGGNVAVTVNGKVIAFEDLDGTAVIDCATGIVLDGSGEDLSDELIAPAWPVTLSHGSNAISWTGAITSVTVSRPWRYI